MKRLTLLTTRIKFEYRMWRRKAVRIIEGKRVSAGISAARRKQWANDPLRLSQPKGVAR